MNTHLPIKSVPHVILDATQFESGKKKEENYHKTLTESNLELSIGYFYHPHKQAQFKVTYDRHGKIDEVETTNLTFFKSLGLTSLKNAMRKKFQFHEKIVNAMAEIEGMNTGDKAKQMVFYGFPDTLDKLSQYMNKSGLDKKFHVLTLQQLRDATGIVDFHIDTLEKYFSTLDMIRRESQDINSLSSRVIERVLSAENNTEYQQEFGWSSDMVIKWTNYLHKYAGYLSVVETLGEKVASKKNDAEAINTIMQFIYKNANPRDIKKLKQAFCDVKSSHNLFIDEVGLVRKHTDRMTTTIKHDNMKSFVYKLMTALRLPQEALRETLIVGKTFSDDEKQILSEMFKVALLRKMEKLGIAFLKEQQLPVCMVASGPHEEIFDEEALKNRPFKGEISGHAQLKDQAGELTRSVWPISYSGTRVLQDPAFGQPRVKLAFMSVDKRAKAFALCGR